MHRRNLRRMAAAGLLLICCLPQSSLYAASVTLSSIGVQYSENFDSLVTSGASSTLPNGWALAETLSKANTTYTGGNGDSSTGDTYSFGLSSSSTDRALGTLYNPNDVRATIGASFINSTGRTITSLDIAYNGEQWRLGATGRGHDRLDFQYSTNASALDTGTYVDFDSLDFVGPINTGTVGGLNGNLSANRLAISSSITGLSIPDGTTFFIRWTDFDVSNSDDGLGVDDFRLTPNSSILAFEGISTPAPMAVWGGMAALGVLAIARTVRERRNPKRSGKFDQAGLR